MQEIDRVAREDVRELGTPSLAVERGTPAPIRRVIEGCNAAVRHRMICNTTSMSAAPYRINNALTNSGGRYAAQPQTLGPVPGTEGVPRTIPNVLAHQEARESRRLGRITATPSTRNNQDWRRSAQAAAVAQAQTPLARGISEQRAVVEARHAAWVASRATDMEASPSNGTNISLLHGRSGDENLFSTEQRERVGGTQDTEAGDPDSPFLLRRVAPRLDDGLARERVAPNLPRPGRAPESSGAPLRRITITNDTESRSERNLRRANHAGLQKALEALDVTDFAFYADTLAWEQEWKRQSLARAPKRLPAERAAA
jgi:hypothetical protein